MVSTKKDNVLAVLSLSGGNDGLNTVIPYANGLYRDFRPTLGISADQVIKLNDDIGLHPTMGPLKKFWDEGKLAIFLGIGIAMLIELFKPFEGIGGLGLGGAISINLCGAAVLAVWLLGGGLDIPTRGYIGLWGLVGILVSLSIVELVNNRLSKEV